METSHDPRRALVPAPLRRRPQRAPPPPAAAPTAPPPDRPADIEYLSQVARAADRLGFTGILTPTGAWCEDAWLSVAALARDTERLKFLVAFRPGFVVPALAAHMAATPQRISRGRLLLHVLPGGAAREQRAYGDFLSHDERYERTAEFLQVVRRSWEAEPFDFD